MSTVEESPPDKDPGVQEINKTDRSKESGDNVSSAGTEPAMLEEEEMPSYVSLNSLPRPDESKTEQIIQQTENPMENEEKASSPCQSEHGADSVCVVSSEEMMDDYDSDDMDMEDEEEEDENEGDFEHEDDVEDEEDEDEESDGDIEPEQFERSSDDFVLRYDGGLQKRLKERSRSLQDVTNSGGNLSRFVGKRRSIDPPFSRQIIQESLEDPLLIRKKASRSIKYDHIPSKVKLYIEEMKKQNRRNSTERLIRENCQETASSAVNTRGDDAENLVLDGNKKKIKEYAQNVIDELARNNERDTIEDDYEDPLATNERTQRRSANAFSGIKEIEETKNRTNLDSCPQNLAVTEYTNKTAKVNGLVDHGDNNGMILETNGEEQIATITNISTVSYEEFANGGKSSTMLVRNSSSQENENDDRPERVEEARPVERMITDERTTTEHANNAVQLPAWNLRRLTNDEPVKRRVYGQIDSEVHHMILNEINSLRQETKNLREELQRANELKLEEFRKMNARPETTVASIQTESTDEEEKMEASNSKSEQASMSTNFSSSAKFTESTCRIEMSTLPSMETVPTDDSAITGDRSVSQNVKPSSPTAFAVCSEILGIISNISQSLSKSRDKDSSNAEINSCDEFSRSKLQTFDLTGNDAAMPRGKKRKISDTLNSTESFKIPCTPGETRRKASSGVRFEARKERVDDERNDNGDATDDEESGKVKFYVYNEDPDRKTRSFLLQAEDPSGNQEDSKVGVTRECGPFLLDNVSLRMSETNGIINIWGKEIEYSEGRTEVTAESNSQDMEKCDSAFTSRPFNCQSTPYMKNHSNAPACCSTKKMRASPKFNRSGTAKHHRSATMDFSRGNADDDELDCDATITDYENSDCHRHASRCNKHRTNVSSCERLENEIVHESPYEANFLASHEKCRHASLTRQQDKFQNRASSCNHASRNSHDFHQTKTNHSSCNCNISSCGATIETRRQDCQGNCHGSCNRVISYEDDGEPLLSGDSPIEPPETKRRRVSGKKLRDIITDLLRGCSPCKNPRNMSSISGANLPNVVPNIVITPCSPSLNRPSCSKQSQSCAINPKPPCNRLADDGCCEVCEQRQEIRTTIRNELEIIQGDIEHIQMRSKALYSLLQKLV